MARTPRPPSAPTGLADRLLAACLLPFFFNGAIVICIATLSSFHNSWHSFRGVTRLMRFVYLDSAAGALFMLLAPAAVGFLGGTPGATALLGHAFYTHTKPQPLITAALWTGIGLVLWWAHGAAGG